MSKKRFKFQIPIGDWSDDGHGKCQYFTASSFKSFEDVCRAYEKAKEKFKDDDFSPESFCNEYESSSVDPKTIDLMKKHGFYTDDMGDFEDFYVDEMADFVVWFINQGDPELKVKLEVDPVPCLNNWQYSKIVKGKTLDQFGYGMFS